MLNIRKYGAGTRVHFIGIGGISMSGLAEISITNKYVVTGSDFQNSSNIERLQKLGANIVIGHASENIKKPDIVVYTAAIKEDNVELIAAHESGAVVVDRAEYLGAIMKLYTTPIAIAGTHGKTTTTGMMAHVLLEAKRNPTISIGGHLPRIKGNIKVGGNNLFLTEACEYSGSFLKFSPLISVILNIEQDHLDYFKDIEDIRDTFTKFAELTPPDGCIVANYDDENIELALLEVDRVVVYYGLTGGDFTVKDVTYDAFNRPTFTVMALKKELGSITLNVAGEHNISNALAVVAIANTLGVPFKMVVRGLHTFYGVERRFERRGMVNGAQIFDDYAHHPTEIATTIKTAKAIAKKDIYVVFQPHTYTRTIALFNDFVEVFKDSGVKLIITNIYAAREEDTGEVSGEKLAKAIKGAKHIPTFDECASYLRSVVKEDDLVITMGAGNVVDVCELLKVDESENEGE